MNYQEALAWLYGTQLTGIKLGLEGITRLLDFFDRPQSRSPSIHVAGTNGKGSVCALTSAALQAHGLKVGRFTSPHLVDFRERLTINDQPPTESWVAQHLSQLRDYAKSNTPQPTFFEITTALAFQFFAGEKVDFAVLETGMGGRFDATNVVDPAISVITPIGLDHTQWLGSTLEKIAFEKAGIIKPGRPVLSAPQHPEALAVLKAAADRNHTSLQVISTPWAGPLKLRGEHQRWNAALAAATVRLAYPNYDNELLNQGLANAEWPGRFQQIGRVILDAAHNPHAAKSLVQTWQEVVAPARGTLIFGALSDKDWAETLQILSPLATRIYLVPVRSARKVDPSELATAVPRAENFPDLESALIKARSHPEPILITGSLFLVGEALTLLRKEPPPRPSLQ